MKASTAAARSVQGRGLIFDLDGTLADTLDDIAGAVNAGLAQMGEIPQTKEQIGLQIGDGLLELCRRVLATACGPPPERRVADLAERVARFYALHLVDRTRLYPGIAPLLADLARAGVPLAVLSNKPDRHTRGIVAALVPSGTFRVVAGAREGVPKKPDPAAALEIAAALGLPPGECLFVGDSGVDMQTARRAGMIPVGVLWGLREREELEREGAAALVAAPKEIAALVAGPGRRGVR